MVGVGDDYKDELDQTDAEVDAAFDRTANIGRMIGTLTEAELIVAAVDTIPPEHQRSIDRVMANALQEIEWAGD